MALTYHKTVDSPYSFSEDSASTTKSKLNNNNTIFENNDQGIEDRLEDTLDDLFGSGIINGMEASLPGGLAINVSSGAALIGVRVAWAGGNVSVQASQSPGYIYFAQDGTWSTSPPSDKSYITYASYTSNATDVTSVTRVAKILVPQIVTYSDTISDIVILGDSTDYKIDHSAQGELEIIGTLKLNVTPSNIFYVEHLYPGGITDDSDFETSGQPYEDTKTVFYVRITRRSGYSYADYPTVTLDWERTGLAYG